MMAAKKRITPTKKSGYPIETLMDRARATPTPPKKARKARVRGKYSKLGFFQTFSLIFEKNELLPSEKRLTDEQITQLILEEFPHKKGLKKSIFGRENVQYWRLLYNKGVMTHGQRPPKVSFRYNEQGLAVSHARKGCKILTATERRDWVRKYNAIYEAHLHYRECKAGKEPSDDEQSTTEPPATTTSADTFGGTDS